MADKCAEHHKCCFIFRAADVAAAILEFLYLLQIRSKIVNTGRKTFKTLVLHTGGTIGMVKQNGVLSPDTTGLIKDYIRNTPQLNDFTLHNRLGLGEDKFVTRFGNRTVITSFLQYHPLLDSSNIGPEEWKKIARDIWTNYHHYDGFIVLHGTDTMAYTSSALSFMVNNLQKPIILTGSQLPIFDVRTDAISNIISSLYFASSFPTCPIVAVAFGGKVFRGNRVEKVNNLSFHAFESPNAEPLVDTQNNIFAMENVLNGNSEKNIIQNLDSVFNVNTSLETEISLIYLVPGIKLAVIQACLSGGIKGAVLVSFGNGNIPSNREDILNELRLAAANNVLIVNVTQCICGTAMGNYEAGSVLNELGVVNGRDMTIPAAYTKLAYVLGHYHLSFEEKKKLMNSNLKDEFTEQ